MRTNNCSYCGAPIEWLVLPRTGESVPVDLCSGFAHFCQKEPVFPTVGAPVEVD